MLTAKRLGEVLSYDPSEGQFRWIAHCSSAAPKGAIAGTVDRNGYRRISLDGSRYLAHRLAWLWVHGDWPTNQIDHINGRRDDNRIANLRDVSAAVNQQNRHRPQGANRFPWVTWKARERRFRAEFMVCGKTITVGHFTDAEEAFRATLARRRAMGIGTEGAPAVAEVARGGA